MKHQYTEWLELADQYMKEKGEAPEPLATWRTMELIEACEAALSLLENIGTGKWAKTPAGDKLRAALRPEKD